LISDFAAVERDDRHLAYGHIDADWLAIVDYFATVHDNYHCHKLEGLMQAIASCGFVWLTPDKVVYCNRPEIAKFDDQGRLHCEGRISRFVARLGRRRI
jgi:hypothetical protein